MPEYLAPAVYVEEVDSGSKPIEGVSTSTTGMIGVTERGPVNVPMLVTGIAEYQRLFGQMLNEALYGGFRFLPHAVEGYFVNGGKRLYVTRVLDSASALPAARQLVAPEAGPVVQTRTVLPAAAGATAIVLEQNPPPGLTASHTVQIHEGLSADFVQIAAAPTAAQVVVLRLPLSFDHTDADAVDHVTLADGAPATDSANLDADTTPGMRTITLNTMSFNPLLARNDVLRLGSGDAEELVVVDVVSANLVTLRAPLMLPHASGPVIGRVMRQTAPPIVGTSTQIAVGATVAPGSVIVPVGASAGLTTAGESVRIKVGSVDLDHFEYRRIGTLRRITLTQPAYADYPAGTRVERVTLGTAGTAVDLTANAEPGAMVIKVSNRTGMAVGGMLAIGLGTETELVEIVSLPAEGSGDNPGDVGLRAALRIRHAAGTDTVVPHPPASPTDIRAFLALDAALGDATLLVSRLGFGPTNAIRLVPPAGGPYFHLVSGAPNAPATVTPQVLALADPLSNAHAAGSVVARRSPMMSVRALDAGQWGNRLQVAMEPQDRPLLTTKVRERLPGGVLRLDSAAGVEAGTELLFIHGSGAATIVTSVKVANIDRQDDYLITLDPTPTLPGEVVEDVPVATREYRLVVELLRQPDPSNPARNTMAIDREVFANLSLDRRHSRYFERVIGCTWDMTTTATTLDDRGRALRRADRRSEGESNYVRVLDLGHAASTGVRLGPVATYMPRPGSTPRLILLPLANGNDMLDTLPNPDDIYIGADNIDPEQRTGLYTLRNIEDISIVAAPGRTSPAIQGALINHCELMRYRFAVLDGLPPPGDSIADIQVQRQQFDTKYAALYHPWLLVPDPFPTNGVIRQDYPIPPSGHMLGIYARTDIERGVHKAPANEVVRGAVGLERLLNKEQHDILNPYPVNVNVIRDFRNNNRGIRVYGGRVITSDSDWKYVNVRRLLIFIEASIDRGLQWVVFEPNAEPLWARVRRAITNFLTLVWRNGALEGTRVEEAFFVKCDRTTMTQTDIDQGRLICLVGVAPVKPAEFVIVRIGLWTAHAED